MPQHGVASTWESDSGAPFWGRSGRNGPLHDRPLAVREMSGPK